MADSSKALVLVTGGSGFVGGHCILELLKAGYRVRATVRSVAKADQLLAIMRDNGVVADGDLTFFEADLKSDVEWREAAKGCLFVQHLASPTSQGPDDTFDSVIRPAVEGTLRVLRAARDAGAKRVVMTSSFAAIGYSRKNGDGPFTEEDWTDPGTAGLSLYVQSKTMAEFMAWKFAATEGAPLGLAVINPAAIFGPSLGPGLSPAFKLLKGLLEGTMKACPNIYLGLVDVRDVAALHFRAMIDPRAGGQRFLAASGEVLSLPEVATLLRAGLGADARRVATRVMPDWRVRLSALLSPEMRAVAQQLGNRKNTNNAKACELLGRQWRSGQEAVLDSARTLLRYNKLRI